MLCPTSADVTINEPWCVAYCSQLVKSTIVVVGGGAAGVAVIRALAEKLNVAKYNLVLITDRPNYVFLPAALRVLIDENAPLGTVFMPYKNLFGKFPGDLKIATVTSIEKLKSPKRGGNVILDTGEQIHYDAIVLATGSIWEGLLAFPKPEKQYLDHVETWRKRFREARDIVVVGGGPVGIEAAGEVKDAFPIKSVTIVHSNPLLLSDIYPKRFRRKVQQGLQRRGVVVLHDDVIEDPTLDNMLRTRGGKELECDLLVTARGGKPNTSYLSLLQPMPLTDRGYVKVTSTLQVQFHPNMFALGDIVDWPEVKQLEKISGGHVDVVVSNLLAFLKEGQPLKDYKGTQDMIIISNGRVRVHIAQLKATLISYFAEWRSRLLGRSLGHNVWRRVIKVI